MSPAELPVSVRELIRRSVRTVADLEALLLVSGDTEREWSVADISRSMYTSPFAAAAQLASLEAQGYMTQGAPGRYRYAPTPELAQAVAELRHAYEHMQARVVEYIYSRPSDSVRSFAHAFKIKGDKP